MDNRNFIRRKHFRSCHPCHHSAPNQMRSKSETSKIATYFQANAVSPKLFYPVSPVSWPPTIRRTHASPITCLRNRRTASSLIVKGHYGRLSEELS
jgi:hypothetical protein